MNDHEINAATLVASVALVIGAVAGGILATLTPLWWTALIPFSLCLVGRSLLEWRRTL